MKKEDFLLGNVAGTEHSGSPGPRDFHVAQELQVKLHDGRIVDATVCAIVDDGGNLQMDFGHEETALGEGIASDRLVSSAALSTFFVRA